MAFGAILACKKKLFMDLAAHRHLNCKHTKIETL
jgi:hypothetical protein